MNRWPAQFVAALFVGLEYTAYLSLVPRRPSADDRWDLELPGGPFANVLGQERPWQFAYGAALMVVLYTAKTVIVFRCPARRTAVAWYVLLLAACLPVLWVLVTTDWNNAHAELAYWFTLPVGLLLIPTIGFALDLAARPYSSGLPYTVKTVAEAVLIPVIFVAWVFAELVLGFFWI